MLNVSARNLNEIVSCLQQFNSKPKLILKTVSLSVAENSLSGSVQSSTHSLLVNCVKRGTDFLYLKLKEVVSNKIMRILDVIPITTNVLQLQVVPPSVKLNVQKSARIYNTEMRGITCRCCYSVVAATQVRHD